MKKILSLVLALALVLAASAAFADVPGNIKDIEGLPEMPEVPTMTTHVSGTTETIVVSEKLNWLNWIQNWNWNQIEWSEDGLTGTFSLAGLTSQPGYGNYSYSYPAPWESSLEWIKYDKGTFPDKVEHFSKWPHGHRHAFDVTLARFEPGYYLEFIDPNGFEFPDYFEADPSDPTSLAKVTTYINDVIAAMGGGSLKTRINRPNGSDLVEENSIVEYFGFGTYDLNGKVGWAPIYDGMAFDGEAANGAHVRYDRFGRCISITSTLTGVNFLNMENEPVKTEVTWGVSKTQFGRKFYIASIKAYIDDETAVEAAFASGGKLLKVAQ